MSECVLPATGGGLVLAVVALGLVSAGVLAVVLSRRGRWVAAIVLVVAGGAAAADRAEAGAPDCAPPPPPTSEPSTPVASLAETGVASTGFVAPPTPPGTSPSASLSVSQRAPGLGASILVFGTGFPAGEPIFLVLYSDPVIVASATSDGTGGFSATVTIPQNTTPGTHTLAAFGGRTTAAAELDIVAGTASTQPPPSTQTSPRPSQAPASSPSLPPSTSSEPPRRPLVENERVFVPLGGEVSGNLLDNGDDLGVPPAAIVSVSSLDAGFDRVPLSFDQPTAIVGRDLAGDPVECGVVTLGADGAYHFAATAATELVSCVVFYELANEVGSHEGDVLFVIGEEGGLATPDATDKAVELLGGETATGSLLEGDDLGTPAATLRSVFDQASFAPLSADTPHELIGTDSAGATVPCGTFSYATDGSYEFVAEAVTDDVTCAVTYLIGNVLGDTATVTFTVTPGSAPTATTKSTRVDIGGEYTGSLLAGDDPGNPRATVVAVLNQVAAASGRDIPLGEPAVLEVTLSPRDFSCGEITVEPNGDYHLQVFATEGIACTLRYAIENGYGRANGELKFQIGFDPPVAHDKTVGVDGLEQVTGSLIAGDDLGDPPGILTDVWELDVAGEPVRQIVSGFESALVGVGPDGAPCGTFSWNGDGSYAFSAADVASAVTCSVLYVIGQNMPNNGGGIGVATVTFVVTPRDVAPSSTTSTTSTTSPSTVPPTTTTTLPATTSTTTTTTLPATTSTTSTTTTTTTTTLPATTTTTTSTTSTTTVPATSTSTTVAGQAPAARDDRQAIHVGGGTYTGNVLANDILGVPPATVRSAVVGGSSMPVPGSATLTNPWGGVCGTISMATDGSYTVVGVADPPIGICAVSYTIGNAAGSATATLSVVREVRPV